jgi:hypothetical protein
MRAGRIVIVPRLRNYRRDQLLAERMDPQDELVPARARPHEELCQSDRTALLSKVQNECADLATGQILPVGQQRDYPGRVVERQTQGT